MLLAFDIGNTSIGCALFEGERIVVRRRFETDPERASYAGEVERALEESEIPGRGPDAAVASSVVSGMAEKLGKAVGDLWGLALVEADPSMDLGIEVEVPRPEAVGIDRLLAAGEAYRLAGGPAVVVGAGTAMTVDLVSGDGRFLGGTISPGLRTALWSLSERTSLLPEVELTAPDGVLGRDTPGCIRSGVIYGTAGAVDRLIFEFLAVSGEGPRVFLTGGDAAFLSPYLRSNHSVAPDLVLHGLASTYRRNED